MKQKIFLLIFSFWISTLGYSQCVVDVTGPSYICQEGVSVHRLEAVGSFVSYLWSPSGETTQKIFITQPGTYYVTATDAYGCQAVDSLVVSYAPEIVPDIQVSSEYICIGDNLHLTVSGAGAGGSYEWDSGLGTAQAHDITVTVSGPSYYNVTLTDAYECTASSFVTVYGVDVPSVQIVPNNVNICKGQTVNIDAVSLSNTNGNTSYSWFPTYGLSSSNSPNVVANPPSSTEYTVVETSEMGGTVCSASASVFVEVDEFNLHTPLQQKVCKGAETTVLVTSTSGVEPFFYTWQVDGISDFSLGNTLNFLDTIDHNTNYTVVGVDGNGCQVSKSFSIEVYPDLKLHGFVNLDTVCSGEPVLFNATISGGTGHPYEFMLDGEYSSTITTIYPESTHNYVFSAEDACQKISDTITIYTYPVPKVSFAPEGYGGCVPYSVKFNPIVEPSDLVSAYSWNFGEADGANFSSLQNPTHIYNLSGEYDVNLKVRTIDNCFADTTIAELINVQKKPKVNFKAEPLRASIIKPIISFENTSSDANLLSYLWDFGDGEISDLTHPEHYFGAVGTYPVQLIGSSVFGCADTITQNVYIIPEIQIFIPTAFTPDNDGLNETFQIKGTNISAEGYLLTIWDRNGNKVFTSESIDDSWNGKFNGDGKFVMPGYYFYILNYQDVYGAEYEKSGEINLIH